MKYLKSLFLFLSIFVSLSASAAVELRVYQKGVASPVFTCLVADKPQISFDASGIIIKSSEVETTLSLKYNEVERIEFKDTDTGIHELNSGTPGLVYVDGQTVILNGVASKESVTIWSIDGKSVSCNMERAGDVIKLHLGHLSQGNYIIHVGKQTFKIFKRS